MTNPLAGTSDDCVIPSNGPKLERFGPGDVLFVPALEDHRFETFTEDLVVWVMFYGPEGGEPEMGSAP